MLGLMASGKSTVGRAVAERLGRPLVDNDEELDRLIGRSAAEHADLHGLSVLHDLETEVLRISLARPRPSVVTAAASLGDREDLRQLLGDHLAVWLDVDPVVLAARVPPEGDHRPFGEEVLAQLHEQRRRRSPNFAAAADLVLTWHHEGPAELTTQVIEGLGLGLEQA